MIWWMQGESDNNPNHNAYFGQLQNLINKFRAQNWYDSSRYFLANETGWFVDANAGIRLAGQDNDANTDFSPSPLKFQSSFSNAQLRYLTGYNVAEPHFLRLDITSETAEDGSPANIHYNEIAFRMIGDRVANKYLFEYGGAR